MTQTIKLPNGDTLNFPDDMPDDAIAKAIADNYPEYAPKQAAQDKPRVLGGLPVKDPNAPAPDPSTAERPSVLAGLPVKGADDAAAAPQLDDATNTDPAQNQFAANRMSRADYEREFRTLNPRATDMAVTLAMAQYDKQQAEARKTADAKRQAGPIKPVPTADEFFNTRLNKRLQQRDQGIVQVQPAHQQQDFSSTSTKHDPNAGGNPDDETALGAAGSFLGRSTSAGLYDLAGAGAKLLDAINPFTLSEGDAAILFKNDPAKLKQMQDESIAMGLSRFARSMQANSSEQMEKVSARGKRDYGQLEYATTDASKSALLSPVKVVGDAVRSLPSSLAMGVTAYFTRGASLRAEQAALAAGLGQEAATAAGVQAAMKFMGNTAAASEGAIGYAQQAIQSADDASKIPMEQLAKTPQFQSLLRQGFTPETARAKIIADIGEHAGQIGGLVDAVTNKFGGAILGKIISEGGPMMKRVLSGAADESATEFVQSAGEQMGQNYANQLNADPNTPLMQGVGEAAVAGAAVGGLMGGVTAGVAGHHAHVDEHQLEQQLEQTVAGGQQAETTRQAALSAWQNNGLSPGSRSSGNGRVEPILGEAGAGAAAQPGRAEPTLGDIAGASSVDDAIAAAQRMVDAPAGPVNLPHPSTLPTAAEIDALEEQAGLLSAAAPEAPAAPPADLPPGGETVPAAQAGNLTNPASSDDTTDWHPFPAEMRSLGVPRAQMPQIRAEHRGAMVNFLNARGISHEQVEVPAESLRPTQREFSVSKVDKALEHEGGNRSILISSDNYVLDGHHQWMAAAVKNEPVQAIRLNAPIKQLVQTVHQFPSSTVDTSSAPQGGLGQGAQLGATSLDDGRPLSPYEASQERIRRQEEAVRQAIEKQAQHRAGQAPQQPGSSVPTEAERAPLPAPKPTAGQRMRERIRRENPFLGFLATHGLNIDERSDTGGQKGRAGNVIVPGFGGSLYRKTGKRLDELAQLAHEAGFLSDEDMANPADNGGTRKLADMIERAVHSKEVIEQPGLLEAAAPSVDQQLHEEAQRLGIETEGKTADQLYDEVAAAHRAEDAKRETSGAADHDEQDAVDHYESQITPQELADADIPFDLNDPRLAPSHELTDEEVNALFGIEKAESPRADRGESEGDVAGAAHEGATPAGQPSRAEIRERLKTIAGRLGIHVKEADGGFSSSSRMVFVPAEDHQVEGAQTAEHVFAHELGHAIMNKREVSFKGFPTKEVRRYIPNWDELVAASKEYRPAVWNHENPKFRDHARKPNEVIADAIGSVLIGERPLSMLEPMMSKLGITEHDMGLRARGQVDGDNLLTSYTAADIVAKQDEEAVRAKAIQAEKDRLEQQRKREQDAKEAKARADATVDDFRLGQDPLDQLNRQDGLFDAPPAADPNAQDRRGLRESDRAAKAMDSAVDEFTIQTKEELSGEDPITGPELRAGAIQWAKDAGLNPGEFLRTLYRKWTRNAAHADLAEHADALLAPGERSSDDIKDSPASAVPAHQYDPERARPLLLLPCAEGKLPGRHKAVDLYKGAMLEVYRKWKPTENRPDVYILSAKHGIIHGDTLIDNYEQPMTKERLAELLAKPVDLSLFKGKNFNEVYIAGSAQYRQLGEKYVEQLRGAGYVGPDAPVDHAPQGAGIGDQRGHLADYLRKVDLRGPANAAELSDQLDAEHAARETQAPDSGKNAAESATKAPESETEAAKSATDDTGADIPADFYPSVTAQYRALGSGELSEMPAHEALAKTREDIQQLEDMLKCMGN